MLNESSDKFLHTSENGKPEVPKVELQKIDARLRCFHYLLFFFAVF